MDKGSKQDSSNSSNSSTSEQNSDQDIPRYKQARPLNITIPPKVSVNSVVAQLAERVVTRAERTQAEHVSQCFCCMYSRYIYVRAHQSKIVQQEFRRSLDKNNKPALDKNHQPDFSRR